MIPAQTIRRSVSNVRRTTKAVKLRRRARNPHGVGQRIHELDFLNFMDRIAELTGPSWDRRADANQKTVANLKGA